jgi:hypothetical protein
VDGESSATHGVEEAGICTFGIIDDALATLARATSCRPDTTRPALHSPQLDQKSVARLAMETDQSSVPETATKYSSGILEETLALLDCRR